MGFRLQSRHSLSRPSGILASAEEPSRCSLCILLFGTLLLGLTLLAGPSLLAQQPNIPTAALPLFNGSETDGFFTIELNTGQTTFIDRLRRNPLAPRSARSDNFFDMIGRPKDPPAKVGEILFGPIITNFGTVRSALFVESSTGYVAFFEQPNKGKLGKITNAMGRPFGPIVHADGNFALLMRRDRAGRTEGAYLYHATTGQTLYLTQVDQLATEPVIVSTDPLPRISGPLSAVALQNGNQETYGYLLIDCGAGRIHFVGLETAAPGSLKSTLLEVDLKQVFGSAEAPAELGHLTAVGLQNSNDATNQILLLDPKSGTLALLDKLESLPAEVSLTKSSRNFYTGLSDTNPDGRYFTPIPHHDNDGLTIGIWLWDSATSNLLYLANPSAPDSATPRRVRIGG